MENLDLSNKQFTQHRNINNKSDFMQITDEGLQESNFSNFHLTQAITKSSKFDKKNKLGKYSYNNVKYAWPINNHMPTFKPKKLILHHN